ncbi:hypothetical protein BCR37DRAFT_385492 [Protomyces lactucae-debilis]|uniref:Hydrophobic surface binding protein A-domain-containing protein n=1 Tax=Protomyces lactucae-debilis TaxID=2754530 RepID=A0A1Y2FV61_PROLT|nr:uncharacterized protein BCR37DRAFT_385492 [Protomyces lactucae-debilis]ORY87066.1 hypothetical protein BCR37DRAFT_385492 [Protomyces lactucae-debilis]
MQFFSLITFAALVAAVPFTKRDEPTVVGGVDNVLTTADPALAPVLAAVTQLETALGTALPPVQSILDLLDSLKIAKRDDNTIVGGVENVLTTADPALAPVLESVSNLEDALGTALPTVGSLLDLLAALKVAK